MWRPPARLPPSISFVPLRISCNTQCSMDEAPCLLHPKNSSSEPRLHRFKALLNRSRKAGAVLSRAGTIERRKGPPFGSIGDAPTRLLHSRRGHTMSVLLAVVCRFETQSASAGAAMTGALGGGTPRAGQWSMGRPVSASIYPCRAGVEMWHSADRTFGRGLPVDLPS
jgi:hypothetical protein